MTTATRPIEHYVEKIRRHLLRRYPDLVLNIVPISETEVFMYFRVDDPEENWFPIIHRASGIAVDALVDAGYRINVQPGN